MDILSVIVLHGSITERNAMDLGSFEDRFIDKPEMKIRGKMHRIILEYDRQKVSRIRSR